MITITGSPSISSGGSISFNGSSQYLALASNAAFAFGTGDFTIETWIYPNNLSGRLWFFDSNTDNVDLNGNGGIFYFSSGGIYSSATNTVITVGAWHHIALVRASGTITLYVNGSSVMSQNGIGYNSASNRAMEIAYSSSQGNGYFNGLMTNFRVVKGTAVYTSAFTPSTSPLTTITNTQLLLNVTDSGTLVADSSINNLTVTNTGSATYSSTTPIISSVGVGIIIGAGISIIPDISYTAGLYKTTYAGYFSNVPSFFATATPTTVGTNPATSVQTTAITEAGSDDGSNFSCEWLGYFLPSTTETYTFFTASDDASYMWIGSNALSGFTTANATVNNGGEHAVQEASGTASLTAGVYYPIRIQFGEAGGGDAMTFNYSTPTITKTTNVTGRVFYNAATNGF